MIFLNRSKTAGVAILENENILKDAKKRESRKKLKKSVPLFFLLAPSFILLLFFSYTPMYGLIIAFKDYVPTLGFWGSPWVGFKHFTQFFNSYQFSLTIRNTLSISLYSILVGFPIPIGIALISNEIRRDKFKKVFQVTTYLPHFISTMVMAGMILLFLSPGSGLIANVLGLFNINMPNLLSNPSYFNDIYVWSDIWQHAGWDSIIYLAALSSIDPAFYEAADMDGASRLQKIFHIDIPLLIPTTMILLILRAGTVLNIGFEKVLLLQNPLNLAGSEIISTYVYKVGLQSYQYSLSTAIGLFNTIVNLMILLTVNWISKRLTKNSLL